MDHETNVTVSTFLPNEMSSPAPMPGDVVRAKIVEASAGTLLVEIAGMRVELPASECSDAAGQSALAVGDEVEVFLDYGSKDDPLVASQAKADALRLWDELAAAEKDGTPIEAEVAALVKGGLSVDIGTRAFLPASQVDLRLMGDPQALIGQVLSVRIIEFDKKRGKIVVSRRVILEAERAAQKAKTLEKLAEGDVVEGTVRKFTQQGAIVDVGGVDGFMDVADLSWGHVRHPSQILTIGHAVKVKVLKIEGEKKGRVSLGLKQLASDPWTEVPAKYPEGKRLRGKVLRLTDFGAFVELEPAVEGLLHVSEMTWSKNPVRPADVVKAGDDVDVVVLDVRLKERRISLGMRQLTPNPWTTLRERYKNGDRMEGSVRGITDFGIFIEVSEGFDGLVHASDMSWTERIKPSERFKKGDRVEAVILNIDVANERIALGIKQLTPDPWQLATERIHPGDQVTGRVTKLVDFGAFVEIAPGVEGLCHITELSQERIDKPDDVVKVGQELTLTVLDIEPDKGRISLTNRVQERAPAEQSNAAEDKSSRFGTALADELAKQLKLSAKD